MIRDIKRFSEWEYDLVVVGGGINGAAIANVAAKNGMKVALLEKGDFASGTSSKSTKLMHGGIRYLENLEFDLVREALKERFIQLRSVPHLVRPVAFTIPVYKKDRRPLWVMKMAVWLYDVLSGKYKIGNHRVLTPEEIHEIEPLVEQNDLVGGVMYYDAQMDDARVCLENVLNAAQKGAHVANYVEVTGFLKENGKARIVRAFDLTNQRPLSIRTKKIICAGGPWTNQLLKIDHKISKKKVRLTKGAHIVYSGQLTQNAVLMTSRQSRRIIFAIPWMGNTLIGTTDTDFVGSPDDVQVKSQDIDYLFKEIARFFPTVQFQRKNILSVFAGLRPLIRRYGNPNNLSRKHTVIESFSGILFVIGGKYTTYRKIAEDCVKKVAPIASDDKYLLYGSGGFYETVSQAAQRYGVQEKTVEYLRGLYGTRYSDVLELTEGDATLRNPICNCSPTIGAQIVYSIQVEMAQLTEDIVWRRLGIGYFPCETKNCEKTIQRMLSTIKSSHP